MNETLLDDNPVATPSSAPPADYLADKSPEEIKRMKYESDNYIRFLEKGRDELRDDYLKLRDEYNSRAKLEEIVDQLTKQQQLTTHEPTLDVNEAQKPAFDPKTIESLVSSKIQEHELTRKQEENFNLVRAKMQQRYGANYGEAVKQQIEDLGITEADLNEMARRQPKVLIRTLGLDQEPAKEGFQSPPSSQRRSDSFAPTVQKRSWSYYEKMRKEDPKTYYHQRTQVQMHQDHANLGKEFEDGNWAALG